MTHRVLAPHALVALVLATGCNTT
ncbi:MAG: hypothetical protein RL005_366, partial [Planctomycetota bacterium]